MSLPRPRGADQPAALGRRHAARLRARAARPRARAAGSGRMWSRRWAPPRQSARRSSSKGSARWASSSASSRANLGSTTHISVLDSAGRACSVTCSQRRGLGRRRPRHGHPSEQRDGRAGPQPARLPPPPRRAADAEHDGPLGRVARRAGRAGARQRRLQPHPLGVAADDRRRRRPRPQRARGGAGAAGALRGRHALRRAGDRPRAPARVRSSSSATSTCSSAASRRCSAATARSRAPAIPGAGAWPCGLDVSGYAAGLCAAISRL